MCFNKALTLEVEKSLLKQELKTKVQDLVTVAEENLLDKYCFVEFNEVFLRNRTKALKVYPRVCCAVDVCRLVHPVRDDHMQYNSITRKIPPCFSIVHFTTDAQAYL